MMEYFRTSTRSLTLKIILILIVVSFIVGSLGSFIIAGKPDYVAKVNGKKISRRQLEQALKNEQNRLQQQLGENFSVLAGNKNYMHQLRQQILDQLINNILIVQYTHQLALNMDDEQVKDFIRKIPYFQTKNQFDNQKYLNTINNIGYSPDEFAQLQRQQLINAQLFQALKNSQFVLPNEIKKISSLLLQKRHVKLATLHFNTFQNQQKLTDKEITDYYDKNKNTFLTPEQVKVSFILMDAENMAKKITVSESEIKRFYNQHLSNFTEPELKHYSVIQLETQKEAQAVLDELKKGADFSDLAKKKSTDSISQKKGGELGWFEPNTTIDVIKQAHLTKKNQLSDVIKSSSNYLILRLNDIKPSYVRTLSMVRNQLIKQIKQEKAIESYYALQKNLSEAIVKDHQTFPYAEKISDLKAQHTDWFSRHDLPSELNVQPVIKAIFEDFLVGKKNQAGDHSQIIDLDGDRAILIRVDKHRPASIKPLDKVRGQVRQKIQAQKAQKQILEEGKKILTALQEGKGGAAMKSASLSFGEEKILAYNSGDNLLNESVFALNLPKKTKPVYGFSFDNDHNGVLIEFSSITEGELTSNEKQAFMGNIQTGYNRSDLEALIKNIRQEADIQIEALDE